MQRPYQNAKLLLSNNYWGGFYLVALVKGPVNDMTAEQDGVSRVAEVIVIDIQVDTDIALDRFRHAIAQSRDSLVKCNPLKFNLLKHPILFSIKIDEAIIIIVWRTVKWFWQVVAAEADVAVAVLEMEGEGGLIVDVGPVVNLFEADESDLRFHGEFLPLLTSCQEQEKKWHNGKQVSHDNESI